MVPRSLLADSTSQTMEAIQRRMEQGLALFVAEKPGEAAKVFEEGYAEHPYSAFLFNAGVCYEKIGKNEAALAKYQEYMRIDPNSPDIAENGAVVPFTISSKLPNTQQMALLVEKNPNILAASCGLERMPTPTMLTLATESSWINSA